jgi:adhesin transport system membrane fusion protein
MGGLMIGITVLIIGLFITWASLSEVEEVTKAPGMVIPMGREQVIESLDAGVLAELFVKEGDIVEKGQKLLRIDDTRSGALHRELVSKNLALKAMKARLQAELEGTPLVFPEEVAAMPELVARETEAYKSRRASLDTAVVDLRRTQRLLSTEIAMTEPLSEKGVVSVVEVLKLKRQYNETVQQINERQSKFRAEVAMEIVKADTDLGQSDEAAKARFDTVERALISSPVRGTIKNLHLTTVGGVVQSGQSLMEIVPIGDELLIEGFVKPSDVAFLRPGLPATIKITAYDYTSYGALKGTVVHVSPDTLRDEKKQPKKDSAAPDEGYYRVLVKTDQIELVRGKNRFPIIPGMTTSVEVKTGKKRIIDYLLKPVLRAKEAFRER